MEDFGIDQPFSVNGRRQQQPNITFSRELVPDADATVKAGGQPKYKEIEVITVQFPGMDSTARRVEERDKQQYKALYDAFAAEAEPPTQGTPLMEWGLMPRTVASEFIHMGYKTVEQVALASDEAKRKLSTLSAWCKKAKDWLDSANTSQNQVVSLKEALDRSEKRNKKLEDQIVLLHQRVEALEGTKLSDEPTRSRNKRSE